VFEFVDAALDAIAQFVEGEVVGDQAPAGGVAGDDGLGAVTGDELAQGIAVIGLVGDHVVGVEAFEQCVCLGSIAALAWG